MNELTTMNRNDFYAPEVRSSSMVAVEQSRAIAETQAAMMVAQARPRDEFKAYGKIMKACERLSLASSGMYAYKRGGQIVEGPSIRLAEVLARAWENITYGLREISRGDGESEVEAFAWDLESNVRVTRNFVVRHIRDKKGGGVKLTEERDIYELTANMGQRRVRACLLELIPGDIVEEAVNKCKTTLAKGDGRPIEDRVRAMLTAFDAVGVTKEMIEGYLQHKVSAIVPAQIVKLTQVYQSINTGVATREEFFDVAGSSDLDKLNSSFDKKPEKKVEKKEAEKKQEEQPVREPIPVEQSTTCKLGPKQDAMTDSSIPDPKLQLEARRCKNAESLDKWRSVNFEKFAASFSDKELGIFIDWVQSLYEEWKAAESE